MNEIKNKGVGKLSELSYVFGIILISLGVVLMTKADFGVSSIVTPAYVVHLKMTEMGFSWCTFGTAEYMLQGVLLIITCLAVRRFKWKYLLSFVTSVIYGLVLDGWFLILGTGAYGSLAVRIVSLAFGMVISSAAIAFLFRTYLPQQVYELFVKEFAERYSIPIRRVKLVFDLSMLVLGVILILSLRVPFFDGIGVGTIICAFVNAPIINLFGKLYDKFFGFEPRFPKIKKFLN